MMRRVFPLRPADTIHLHTINFSDYKNEALMEEEDTIADDNHIRTKRSSLKRSHVSLDESSFCALMEPFASAEELENQDPMASCMSTDHPLFFKSGAKSISSLVTLKKNYSSPASSSYSLSAEKSFRELEYGRDVRRMHDRHSSFDFSADSGMEGCEGITNSSSSSSSSLSSSSNFEASESMAEYFYEAIDSSTEASTNSHLSRSYIVTQKDNATEAKSSCANQSMKLHLDHPMSPLHNSSADKTIESTNVVSSRGHINGSIADHILDDDLVIDSRPRSPLGHDHHISLFSVDTSSCTKLSYPNCVKKLHGGFKFLSSCHYSPFRYFSACLLPRRKLHLRHHTKKINDAYTYNLTSDQQRNNHITSIISPTAEISTSAAILNSSSAIRLDMSCINGSDKSSEAAEKPDNSQVHSLRPDPSSSPLIGHKCQSFRLNSCTFAQPESHGDESQRNNYYKSLYKIKDRKAASFHYGSNYSRPVSAEVIIKPTLSWRSKMDERKILKKGLNRIISKFHHRPITDQNSAELNLNEEEEIFLRKYLALKGEISRLWKEKGRLAQDLFTEVKTWISNDQKINTRVADQNAVLKCNQNVDQGTAHEYYSKIEADPQRQKRKQSYVQNCLEKEQEIKRSKEWSARIEKIKTEERRLRDRVIEMAEEMVKMQREVSSCRSREAFLQSQAEDYEAAVQALVAKCRKSDEEMEKLKLSMESVNMKLRCKEEEVVVLRQENEAMALEKEEILKEFVWLKRASEEQALTFEEIWKHLVDLVNNCSADDDQCNIIKEQSIGKLHRNLIRLALREESLLKEIGFLRAEFATITKPAATILSTTANCDLNSKPNLHSQTDGSEGNICNTSSEMRDSEGNQQDVDHSLNMERMLCLANRRVWQLEHELGIRDDEVKLLQLNLRESEWELKELRSELTWANIQKDGFQKQFEEKDEECTRLASEIAELKELAERLDDELMLKEGEISILREAYSDSDF